MFYKYIKNYYLKIDILFHTFDIKGYSETELVNTLIGLIKVDIVL